jgi:hypothetical protein
MMANEAERPCLNLRCKEMFYKDVHAAPTERELEERKLYGHWDNRSYWCHCTQTPVGPDNRIVDWKSCSQADRSCFTGLKDLA